MIIIAPSAVNSCDGKVILDATQGISNVTITELHLFYGNPIPVVDIPLPSLAIVSGLCSGHYLFTISSDGACDIQELVEIPISTNTVDCNNWTIDTDVLNPTTTTSLDGQIAAVINGGSILTSIYTFIKLYNNLGQLISSSVYDPFVGSNTPFAFIKGGLASGVYTITALDQKLGCSAQKVIKLEAPFCCPDTITITNDGSTTVEGTTVNNNIDNSNENNCGSGGIGGGNGCNTIDNCDDCANCPNCECTPLCELPQFVISLPDSCLLGLFIVEVVEPQPICTLQMFTIELVSSVSKDCSIYPFTIVPIDVTPTILCNIPIFNVTIS